MPDVIIENPILNSPFREPALHWRFGDTGITNEVVETRRVSLYFMPIPASKVRGKQLEHPARALRSQRMDFKHRMEKLAQVVRERQSIELAKIDLQEEMKLLGSEAPGSREAIYPAEMGDLVRRLAALLEAEQEQSTMLWELLEQAHRELVEAHDEIAKACGDD